MNFDGRKNRPLYGNSNTFGVQLGAEYDSPLGNFALSHKPAITYNFSLLKYLNSSHLNLSAGYLNYKPWQPIFTFEDEGVELGKYTTSDFRVYAIYAGWQKDFRLSDVISLGGGVDVGGYFSKYRITISQTGLDSDITTEEQNIYLAAKAGFGFNLAEQVQINLQAKYNFFTPSQTYNSRSTEYSEGGWVSYASWSAGLGIAYKF